MASHVRSALYASALTVTAGAVALFAPLPDPGPAIAVVTYAEPFEDDPFFVCYAHGNRSCTDGTRPGWSGR